MNRRLPALTPQLLFEPCRGAARTVGIVSDVECQVTGVAVRESGRHPREDARPASGTSRCLLQEVGDIQVVRVVAGEVRLHDGRQVHVET